MKKILLLIFFTASLQAGSSNELRERFFNVGIVPIATDAAYADSTMAHLGRKLFFDKVLSGNRNISCATCHHPQLAAADESPLPLGEGGRGLGEFRHLQGGRIVPRNSPALFNLGSAAAHTLMWDGRIARNPENGELHTPEEGLNGPLPRYPEITTLLPTALAAQVLFPLVSAEEMAGQSGSNEVADAPDNFSKWTLITKRVLAYPEYRRLLLEAFPELNSLDEVNIGHIARAISEFEIAAFSTPNARFDDFLRGDDLALQENERRGAELFVNREAVGCTRCHWGPLLSDMQFHAIGMPQIGPGNGGEPDDRGLALLTGKAEDNYKFRTPPLRNVARTGPWGHAGAFSRIEEMIVHYINPARHLEIYDPKRHLSERLMERETLILSFDPDPFRIAARIAALDPLLFPRFNVNRDGVMDLKAFLESLTDETWMRSSWQIVPREVPSGLPVERIQN